MAWRGLKNGVLQPFTMRCNMWKDIKKKKKKTRKRKKTTWKCFSLPSRVLFTFPAGLVTPKRERNVPIIRSRRLPSFSLFPLPFFLFTAIREQKGRVACHQLFSRVRSSSRFSFLLLLSQNSFSCCAFLRWRWRIVWRLKGHAKTPIPS